MSEPLNPMQAAVYTRLINYAPLITKLGGEKIYDHVPQGEDAPYVVIGEDTAIDDDTKTSNGWDMTLVIHCWDFLAAGRKSVKEIMQHVYDALHKQESSLTVTGFSLITMRCTFQTSFQETAIEGSNDHYYHGVQRFRSLVTDN